MTKEKSFWQKIGAVKSDDAPQTLTTQSTSTIQTTVPTSVIAGVENDQFIKMIEKVIEENNLPGIDYFEFKKNIDAMASIPIDEKNKYLSTFTILSAQGCTKEILLSSIVKYIELINKEQISFDSEVKNEFNEKVRKRQEQVDSASKEIEELNSKIIEKNNFILKTKQEIDQESSRIQITEANFKKSIERVIGRLNEDKQKITNYLM